MVVTGAGVNAGVPALQISSVSKSHGALLALSDVSFEVAPGEFFGLLGPNGAGKTTLISIIAGLAQASQGRVAVMGHDVQTDFRSARRSLGVVPQELVFDPFFTVRETLQFQAGYFGLRADDPALKRWIEELLHELSLDDKADTNMRKLSGGMKRRVLVAQALVHKPPVIVLDEPTAGVDVQLRHSLWQFIQRLNREGHTVLLTTHYLEEAQALCSRIAMLKQGKLIALDSTRALLASADEQILSFVLLASETDLTTALPELAARCQLLDGRYRLSFHGAADLAQILADLMQAGCRIDDLQIEQPDLEDVFVTTMAAGGTQAQGMAG